jgi:hypothetical protein
MEGKGANHLLGVLNRPDESIAEIRKAAEVDPLSVPVRNTLVDRLREVGRCEEAIQEANKTLAELPVNELLSAPV